MLPTKGYFQDIECPYFNSICGRPYCHFRHRKKPSETVDEVASETEKEETVVPTYKPTPKSELAKSHIPISYVPDLAFRSERKSRPLPKIEKPTYNPTPISILSSAANKSLSESEANGETLEAIKEIKKNIANAEYDPTISLQPTSDINFEDLSSEFDLIDEIISSSDKTPKIQSDDNLESRAGLNQDENKVIEKSLLKNFKQVDLLPPKVEEKVPKTKEKSKSDLASDRLKKSDKIKNRTNKNHSQERIDGEKPKKENSLEKRHSGDKYSDKPRKLEKNREEIKLITLKVKHKDEKDNKQKNSDRSQDKTPSKEKDSSRDSKNDKHRKSVKDKKKDKEKLAGSSEKSHKSSSRDKHRKEEHKDRKEKNTSSDKHKNRERSKSKSPERTKSHKKSSRTRSTSKERKKSEKRGSSEKASKNEIKTKHEKKYSSDDSSKHKSKHKRSHLDKIEKMSDDDDYNYNNSPLAEDVSDMDSEDEHETMRQCFKIFNEYKAPEKQHPDIPPQIQVREDLFGDDNDNEYAGKKRVAHSNVDKSMTYSQLHPPVKPKTVMTPGQSLSNRYKLARLAQANREQDSLRPPSINPPPVKRQASTLLEAARARKIRKEEPPPPEQSTCLVDEILQGSSNLSSKTSSLQQPKPIVKKIAPAQNVLLMAKAKERISLIKPTPYVPKTIAQSQKAPRVAHIPEASLANIPDVLQADKSKLPVNVRSRFLTMIADECVKMYMSKQEAYERALNEEFSCYEKCKVVATYRNSAMLAVNRLRKEVQERTSSGLGLIGVGENTGRDPKAAFKGKSFYHKIEKWILTDEELDLHGYPFEDETCSGRVVIKNSRRKLPDNLDENQRYCVRCRKVYQVDDDGWPLFEEECLYHPLKKRTIRGEQTYLCCRSNDDTGCATSDTHVSEGFSSSEVEGFQTTMEPESHDDPRNFAVYALDCEMCYTTKGLELTRVTVVDTECKTVYESLVKPLNPIIDYNTRFSGITKEQMDRTSTNILQVQANILHLCNSKTILVGHSLESDMKALKIVHRTIIDTSVLFPHKMGLPHKRALKVLASEYLRKIIQNDIAGHDSAEDAVTCMELLKWKLKEEMKGR